MTDSFIDPESLNSSIFSIQAFADEDGKNRIINSDIMSVDFDGSVPIISNNIEVADLEPGMSFIVPGTESLVTVISIDYDDPELVDSPSDDYVVSYLSDSGDIQTIILDASDEVDVFYEDASEIALGQTGWAITQGGNAIFNNITARGKIEALSGDIGGWEINPQGELEDGSLLYDASVPLGESGGGSYLTGIYTGFGEHTDDWETEGDIHQPSKIFMIYGPGLDHKIPLWNDPKTTFYVDGHGYFSLGDKLTFDANTGDLNIGGYASEEDLEDLEESFDSFIDDLNDRISASISDLVVDFDSLSASIDFLYDAGFITNTDLVTTGRTTINGNNITTGVINANLVNVSSGLTGNRGIKINSLGLFGYDSFGNPTFSINSGTGAATFSGNVTGSIITGSTINTGPSNALVTIAQYFNGRQNQGYIQFTDDWYGGTYFIAPANPPNGPALQLSGNLRLSGNLVIPPGNTVSGGGVVTTNNVYANPSWISSLAGSKITGNISGNANNITQYNVNQNVGTNNSPSFNAIGSLSGQGAGQGTHYLHWNTTGGTVTRSTSLPSGSSRVLKDEINTFNVSPSWTTQINDIYTFKYKSDINDFGSASAPTQLGIIIDDIEDVQEIQPLIFEVNGIKAFDYTKVGILLIPVMNDLIKKINDQQQLLENLQGRVLQLESQLGG